MRLFSFLFLVGFCGQDALCLPVAVPYNSYTDSSKTTTGQIGVDALDAELNQLRNENRHEIDATVIGDEKADAPTAIVPATAGRKNPTESALTKSSSSNRTFERSAERPSGEMTSEEMEKDGISDSANSDAKKPHHQTRQTLLTKEYPNQAPPEPDEVISNAQQIEIDIGNEGGGEEMGEADDDDDNGTEDSQTPEPVSKPGNDNTIDISSEFEIEEAAKRGPFAQVVDLPGRKDDGGQRAAEDGTSPENVTADKEGQPDDSQAQKEANELHQLASKNSANERTTDVVPASTANDGSTDSNAASSLTTEQEPNVTPTSTPDSVSTNNVPSVEPTLSPQEENLRGSLQSIRQSWVMPLPFKKRSVPAREGPRQQVSSDRDDRNRRNPGDNLTAEEIVMQLMVKLTEKPVNWDEIRALLDKSEMKSTAPLRSQAKSSERNKDRKHKSSMKQYQTVGDKGTSFHHVNSVLSKDSGTAHFPNSRNRGKSHKQRWEKSSPGQSFTGSESRGHDPYISVKVYPAKQQKIWTEGSTVPREQAFAVEYPVAVIGHRSKGDSTERELAEESTRGRARQLTRQQQQVKMSSATDDMEEQLRLVSGLHRRLQHHLLQKERMSRQMNSKAPGNKQQSGKSP